MAEFINSQKLKDNSNLENKYKNSIYLKKGCYLKMDSLIKLTDSQSRNDVIEKAIDFYFGYISSQTSQEFLCGVLGTKMEGIIETLGNRLARMAFKNAVELDIQTRLLASVVNINPASFSKLRKNSVDTVKKTNGTISFMDAEHEKFNPEDDT